MSPSRLLCAFLALVFGVSSLAARTVRLMDLESARQAEAMLMPHLWARVVQIENPRRAGGYPKRLYATVFEFDGRLWLYAPFNGTQSLGVNRGETPHDAERILVLLRAVNAGFSSCEFVPATSAPEADPEARFAKLRQGCFVESLHALLTLARKGAAVREAGLFTYYLRNPRGAVMGHTGLLYRTAAGRFFWDPERPEEPIAVESRPDHRQALAREAGASPALDLVGTHYLAITTGEGPSGPDALGGAAPTQVAMAQN